MSTFASQSIYGDHELIQAMPLNTAKVKLVYLDATTPSAVINVSQDTKLVEIAVVADVESTDMVFMRMSDLPIEEDGALWPICKVKGVTRLTHSVVTETREMTFSIVPPSTGGSANIYVMEA